MVIHLFNLNCYYPEFSYFGRRSLLITMLTGVNIQKHLSELGLKPKEINKLKIEDAIHYLRYCHYKPGRDSSILFLGFSEEDTKFLVDNAKNCRLSIKKALSNELNFVCVSENVPTEKIDEARDLGSIILTKNDFEIIFNEIEFNLHWNELFCEQLVPKELRVAKFLSNFDVNIAVHSFAQDSQNIYTVNIYLMTCTCKDFEKKNRSQYLRGDIRRLCKHLMVHYRFPFAVRGLSDLNRFIIKSGYSVDKHFRYFNMEKIPLPIAVNFETKDDWWNIFMANEQGVYYRYGYSPTDKRFSYDDKPRGFVLELRKKLNELKHQLPTDDNSNIFINDHVKKGCAYFGMAILLIFAAIIILILGIILYAIFG